MKVIYVGGPFRGPNHFAIAENVRQAERLALDVWRLGAVAICPHLNTAHFTGCLPDERWLAGDLEILNRCDAIIVTDDWLRSSGTRAEVRHAEARGLPVFLTLEDLGWWLNAAEVRCSCGTLTIGASGDE